MTDPEADDGEEWEFSLSDIEEREADVGADVDVDVEDPAGADTAREGRRAGALEPGSPSLENAAFVLLGIGFTLFVISRLVLG